MEAGHIQAAPPHEQMCLAVSFAVPSHSKLQKKEKIADRKKFLNLHFCCSLPLYSMYLLSRSCSSSLRSMSACHRKGLKLREQWPSHCDLIHGSYHRLFPSLEKIGWWIILSTTGEMTSGSERSLMVGSNRAFHGKRPYRLWASSYPRSSPGTAIQRAPEEQNGSVTVRHWPMGFTSLKALQRKYVFVQAGLSF